jgi:hypothetical protein
MAKVFYIAHLFCPPKAFVATKAGIRLERAD